LRPQTDEDIRLSVIGGQRSTRNQGLPGIRNIFDLKKKLKRAKLTRWNYVMSDEEKKKFEEYSKMKFLSPELESDDADENDEE